MPTDYTCEGCNVRFSVGWYHYHSFSTGYGAATLTVCSRCGTPHCIEHAVEATIFPEYDSFCDVVIKEIPPAARLEVMGKLRETLRLSLDEAKRVVNAPPIALGHDVGRYQVLEIKTAYEAIKGIKVHAEEIRREPNPHHAPQQQDRLLMIALGPDEGVVMRNLSGTRKEMKIAGPREGICGEFDLRLQACGHCSTAGSLLGAQDSVFTACPRCHAPIKETGGWVT